MPMTSKGFIPLRFNGNYPRATPPERSRRRIANAEKAVKREKETLLPGFQRFQSAEERLAHYEDGLVRWWQRLRDFRARNWRELRRRLDRLNDEEKIRFCERWNNCFGPKDPECALDMIRNMFPNHPWERSRDEKDGSGR